MSPRRLLGGGLAALLLAACTSALRSADRAFEAGDYAAAAAGYERALGVRRSGEGADRALYRLAIVHALPSNPLRDVPRAGELLGELLKRSPSGRGAQQARLVLPLVQQIGRLEDQLQEEAASVVVLQASVDAASARFRELDATLQGRDEELARVRTSLAEARERLLRVESELEALKRIDLRRHP